MHTRINFLAAFLLASACAPAATVRPVPSDEPALPPPPEVRGELAIDVVYPGQGSTIAAVDSTFIFGNLGHGGATLTINGAPVEVAPNGAWLAFLPVPPDGVYELVAVAGEQTAEETRTVQVPSMASPSGPGTLRIIESSVRPASVTTAARGEPIEVSFRGTPGGMARLVLADGTVVPLVERQAIDRVAGFMLDDVEASTAVSEYAGTFPLTTPIVSPDPEVDPPTLIEPAGYIEQRELEAAEGVEAYFELARGDQVVRVPLDAAIGIIEPTRPRVAVAATARPDSTVVGRRQIGSDQAWDFFWPNGTRFAIDAEASGFYRVRLTDETTAWVSQSDVRLLPAGTPRPTGFVGPSIQVVPRDGWVDVRFATSERLPFRVDPDEWGLSIQFYGATGRPAYLGYGETDAFVDRFDWEQLTDELYRFDIDLSRPLWGFRYHWEGSYLVLQVRRPPTVDPARPLAGLRVGVDAGHRASEADTGAIGPTRLLEVDAALRVVDRLVPMLRNAGAEIVHVRTDSAFVPLIQRPIIASRENADLLVSVHFNAFPDGVNPFENHGTTMFYYWPQSLELARHFQREILGEFGLPDRGVRFQNLAMPRTSWMPSVLTETLFMMLPQNEAALQDPEVIERIAGAHLRAMEAFARERAAATVPIARSQ